MTKRRVCVLTGKRGGFGALTPTMNAIAGHRSLELAVLVTDQHLYKRFGRTVSEVEENFPIAGAIDMEQRGDSNRDRARAIGVCLTKAADVLGKIAPDILVVIGDRGEVVAATIAAHNLRIPIAHIQGGDLSGSLDDANRHAVTKFSHIHLVSTKASARRVLKMGEEPWRVHVVGDTHVDALLPSELTPEETLRTRYELSTDEPFLLVLQHSDATCPEDSGRQMAATMAAVRSLGLRALVVYPCSDQGFEGILAEIETARGTPGLTIHKNIPAPDFAGLQSIAGCLVGNSSAGLIEAPYFGLPAVNIGKRQIGRQHCGNVVHVPYDRRRIGTAIRRALDDKVFRARLRRIRPPFGDGTSYKKITRILARTPLGEKLLNKQLNY